MTTPEKQNQTHKKQNFKHARQSSKTARFEPSRTHNLGRAASIGEPEWFDFPESHITPTTTSTNCFFGLKCKHMSKWCHLVRFYSKPEIQCSLTKLAKSGVIEHDTRQVSNICFCRSQHQRQKREMTGSMLNATSTN